MSVWKRLGLFIEEKGISYYAFENSIKASRGAISKAVKDNKSIGSSVLENILNEYNDLNPEWLLRGIGNMIKDDSQSDFSIAREPLEDYGCGRCRDKERIIEEKEQRIITLKNMITILERHIYELESGGKKRGAS